MGFVKKTWKDRISQYPNRRTINDGIVTKTVTVGRDEGEVTEEGDAFSASVMNELEQRIYNAIEQGGGGGGGGGGHTIIDNEGVSLTQRSGLQFKGAYSDDNETDDITEVNIVRNMTKAEFDLLPAAEKVGLINITDITSSRGDRFQPVVYSEEEQEIGVWTDGKPIYKKTFFFETLSNEYKDLDSLNIETVCKIECVVDIGSRKITYSEGYRGSNEYVMAYVEYGRTSTPYMRLACTGPSGNGKTAIVTLYYTKTTDTAGSGQWTPQGVPAVHYSTAEQIVGTWVDGSTLYEKTIDCGALLDNDIKSIPLNISNLGTVYETKIQMVNSSGVSTNLPYVSTSGSDTVYSFITGNDLRIGTRSDRTSYTAYATIRYTKTST